MSAQISSSLRFVSTKFRCARVPDVLDGRTVSGTLPRSFVASPRSRQNICRANKETRNGRGLRFAAETVNKGVRASEGETGLNRVIVAVLTGHNDSRVGDGCAVTRDESPNGTWFY